MLLFRRWQSRDFIGLDLQNVLDDQKIAVHSLVGHFFAATSGLVTPELTGRL